MLAMAAVRYKDISSMAGTLVHVCSIFPERRSSLNAIYAFRNRFDRRRRFHSLDIPTSAASELRNWLIFLKTPPLARSFRPPSVSFPHLVYSDASNLGCGVVIDGKAQAWALPGIIDQGEMDIGVMEAWALQLALEACVSLGAKDCTVRFQVDNLGAMHGSSDLAVAQTQSRVLLQSVKENTRVSYGRGIIAYLAWCEDLGLPEHFRFPAAINILLLYLQKDMSKLRPGTIDKRAHALQYWHRVQRMPWALEKGVTRTLQKTAKIEGLPPFEKRRPVRLNDLKAMVSHHQPDDNAHVAILAAALLAFFAMCRPGEVTVRSASEPHSDRARWAHIVEHPPMTADGVASFALRLPSEKVHGKDGWDRIAAEQRQMPELCPVRAMRRHLVANALRPGEEGLVHGAFSYVSNTGARTELTDGLFGRTVNAWLTTANRERVTGHCFRIGGATLLFAAGEPLEDIRLRGGWGSDAYLLYLRDIYVRQATMFSDLDLQSLC
ncbi:hypothetical protein CF328_g7136, partial [Tilletia controversa]